MYTVNVKDNDGSAKRRAQSDGYHAYSADGVTAIETNEKTEKRARKVASRYGKVLYAYE